MRVAIADVRVSLGIGSDLLRRFVIAWLMSTVIELERLSTHGISLTERSLVLLVKDIQIRPRPHHE